MSVIVEILYGTGEGGKGKRNVRTSTISSDVEGEYIRMCISSC
jgi:hypothetical protein